MTGIYLYNLRACMGLGKALNAMKACVQACKVFPILIGLWASWDIKVLFPAPVTPIKAMNISLSLDRGK